MTCRRILEHGGPSSISPIVEILRAVAVPKPRNLRSHVVVTGPLSAGALDARSAILHQKIFEGGLASLKPIDKECGDSGNQGLIGAETPGWKEGRRDERRAERKSCVRCSGMSINLDGKVREVSGCPRRSQMSKIPNAGP